MKHLKHMYSEPSLDKHLRKHTPIYVSMYNGDCGPCDTKYRLSFLLP